MTFDPRKHIHYIEDTSLSGTQKEECATALWNFCLEVIERDVKQHQIDLAREAANDNRDTPAKHAVELRAASLAQEFNQESDDRPA